MFRTNSFKKSSSLTTITNDNIKKLLIAARNGNLGLAGDIGSIRNLIEVAKIDVNSTLDFEFEGIPAGTSALMLAAGYANKQVFEYLLCVDYIPEEDGQAPNELEKVFYTRKDLLAKIDLTAVNSQKQNALEFILRSPKYTTHAHILDEAAFELITVAEKLGQHRRLLQMNLQMDSPAFLWAVEKGFLQTSIKMLKLGVPYDVRLVPLITPAGNLPYGDCSPLEAAIANNVSLKLVEALVNGTITELESYEAAERESRTIRTQKSQIDLHKGLLPNLDAITLAAKYASLEMFNFLLRSLPTDAALSLNYTELAVHALLTKKLIIDNNGDTCEVPNPNIDVAKAILQRPVLNAQLNIKSFIFPAIAAGEEMINFLAKPPYNVDFTQAVKGDITPMAYARTIEAIHSIPALLALGGDIKQLDDIPHAKETFTYPVPDLDELQYFTGTLLQYVALNASTTNMQELLEQLLDLPEEEFAQASKFAQIQSIADILHRQNNVIELLKGKNLLAEAKVSEVEEDAAPGPRRRPSFSWGGFTGCMRAPESPNTTNSPKPMFPPQFSPINTPITPFNTAGGGNYTPMTFLFSRGKRANSLVCELEKQSASPEGLITSPTLTISSPLVVEPVPEVEVPNRNRSSDKLTMI